MSQKTPRRTGTHRTRTRQPPAPPLTERSAELESTILETPVCHFVYYEDHPPFVRYFLFHPDHFRALQEIFGDSPESPGLGQEEAWRRVRRFGELMLAIDEFGFTADLYLDQRVVQQDEVEPLIVETRNFLLQIHPGPEGGVLIVYWMKEIASHSFEIEGMPADA